MNKFISLTKYNLTLVLRDISGIMLAFLMPIGFYILFSNMLQGMPTGGASMRELLVPLYTIIIIGNAVITVFGGVYSQARESGNLTKYKFLGVNELLFSASLYTATLIFQIIVIVSFLLFAAVYGRVPFPIGQAFPVAVVLLVINLYQYAVSFFLNAVVRKSSLYNSISLTFYMFQMFLGGLTFPMEMFPDFLRKVLYIVNPIIYGRNALLDVWVFKTGLQAVLPELCVLLAVSAGLLGVGGAVNSAVRRNRTVAPVKTVQTV